MPLSKCWYGKVQFNQSVSGQLIFLLEEEQNMLLQPFGEPQAPLYDVKLVGVSKTFGVTWAVRDLTLQVEQGIFYSLLGPSGCGKTTTLRLIAGFEQPAAGQVLIRGINVAGLP